MIETHEPSRHAAKREERTDIDSLDRIAHVLDDLIRIPFLNIRIGLDPILGLLPWVGDTFSALFSLYLIGASVQYRAPKIVILRMAINVIFDFLLGIIPFVGDASDFFVKSNRWNMNLLRRHARERRRPGLSDYLFVTAVIAGLVSVIAGGIWLIFQAIRAIGVF